MQPGGGFLHQTIESYNSTASEYANRFSSVILEEHLGRFIGMARSNNGPVLDAGCGSGRDCSYMAARGLEVVGVDLSSGLLLESLARGFPQVAIADFRHLPFSDATFAGIWSCASLVHLPPDETKRAISDFSRTLKPGGALFVSVRHGSGDEWRPDGKGGSRWFHFYSASMMQEILDDAGIEVVDCIVEPGIAHGEWINIFARRLQ